MANNQKVIRDLGNAKNRLDELDGSDAKMGARIDAVLEAMKDCILSDNINEIHEGYAILHMPVCTNGDHVQAYSAIKTALSAALAEDLEEQKKRQSGSLGSSGGRFW